MEPINNPFLGRDDYACFACSPDHPAGLKMKFFQDGDQVVCFWEPDSRFEGYHGVLHGGIQSTLFDEIASWLVFVKLKTAGVTSRLAVEFLRPVHITRGRIRLTAVLAETRGRVAVVRAQLFDSRNHLCARAEVEYVIYSPELAEKKLAYPGYERFFG
jgi:uncharacterized protein (TIGR00369 family)